jgi:hypothetical protein
VFAAAAAAPNVARFPVLPRVAPPVGLSVQLARLLVRPPHEPVPRADSHPEAAALVRRAPARAAGLTEWASEVAPRVARACPEPPCSAGGPRPEQILRAVRETPSPAADADAAVAVPRAGAPLLQPLFRVSAPLRARPRQPAAGEFQAPPPRSALPPRRRSRSNCSTRSAGLPRHRRSGATSPPPRRRSSSSEFFSR